MTALLAILLLASPFPGPAAAAGASAPGWSRLEGGLGLSWLEPGKAGKHRLRFSRFDGRAWSAPSTVVESERLVLNWADVPSVVEEPGGTLVAHWAEQNGAEPHAYDVALARSVDRGKTWKRVPAPHRDGTATEHGFVSLFAEPRGARAVWLDGRETLDGGATALRSAAVGGAEDAVLDARVCDCCSTAAAVAAAGPVVVYRDRSANETRDISVVRRAAGTWSEPRSLGADGWSISGCPVNGPAISARGPEVAVAWFTAAKGRPRVRAALSSDSAASFGAPLEVDGPEGKRAPLGRVEVALVGDGEAVVAWMAAERETASLLLRRVARDGRLGAPVSVGTASATRGSGRPGLERLGGDLVLVWTELAAPSRLAFARVALAALPAPAAFGPADAGAPATSAAPAVAPALAVTDLAGAPASLEKLRGKAVLLNFWATWCEPCRHELPELSALDAELRARGLFVIGVSVDAAASREELQAFAQRRKVSYPLWRDPQEKLAGAFGVQTLPATFLIDAAGAVVWSATGAIRADDPGLRAALARALGGK